MPTPEPTPNPGDVTLVVAARSGDSHAWRTLLASHQDRLFAICVRMVGNRERAADLLQDSLVKIIEGLGSYDGRAKLSTWMIRITMNVCLSWLRSQKYRRHASLDLPTPEGAPRSDQIPDRRVGEHSRPSRVEEEELRRHVAAALAAIAPEHRAILVLRDVRGLEYEQAAEALDVPVGTIKSRLFRARAALRQELERMAAAETTAHPTAHRANPR